MTRHKEWRYCVEFCVEINCEKYQRKMSRRFSQTLSFFCQFVCVFLGKKRWWEAQPKRKFGRWPLLQRRRPLVSNPLQTLALTLTSKKEQKKKKKDWMGNELHAQLYAAAFKNCVLTHVEQTYPYSIGERERVSESAETLQRQAIYCFSKKCSIFRCCCCCRCRRNGYLLHLSAVCVPSAASNTTNIFSNWVSDWWSPAPGSASQDGDDHNDDDDDGKTETYTLPLFFLHPLLLLKFAAKIVLLLDSKKKW